MPSLSSSVRSTADPGLIGLLGFALATFIAQLAHIGVHDEHAVFWVGAVFGGVVQVTAGMLSYFRGDDFHFLVYSAFGWYWICMPGFLLGAELGFFEVDGPARGVFTSIFALIAVLFAYPAATHNSVLPVTLLLVGSGLGLESISAFGGPAAFGFVGSLLLIAASLCAAYMLVEKFVWRTLHRRTVPLGPPWFSADADPSA